MTCSLLALSTGIISCFASPQLVPHQDFCLEEDLACAGMCVEKHFLPLEAYSSEYCMFNQVCHFHYIIPLQERKPSLGDQNSGIGSFANSDFCSRRAILYF